MSLTSIIIIPLLCIFHLQQQILLVMLTLIRITILIKEVVFLVFSQLDFKILNQPMLIIVHYLVAQ